MRGDYTPFISKSFHILDHLIPLIFSKDSENLKFLDIGLWEVGAKKTLKRKEQQKKKIHEFFLLAATILHPLWANVFFKYETTSFHYFSPRRLFTSTSQSRISTIFTDFESLGKSNGKKCSQIWKISLIKGVKLPRKKTLVFGEFCLTEPDFFGIGVSHSVFTVFCPPLPEVKCPNSLDFWNPWGKVMKRNGFRFDNFCS